MTKTKTKKRAKYPDIGERIREIRERAGLTQPEFAKFLRQSDSHIKLVENGYVNADLRLLKIISEKYKVTLDWLIRG